ncbi:hypothetical protein M3Y95_00272100 [Aphelenchoides besseyi]|nr:hypothetical protein M3Y95_00272100 [Aphelenchoides besseyi]
MNACSALGLYLSYICTRVSFFLAIMNIGVEEFKAVSQWKAAVVFSVYAFGIMSNAGSMLMAVNRLTAMVLRKHYDQLWHKIFPFLVIVVVVLPFVLFAQVWSSRGFFDTECFEDAPFLDYFTIDMNIEKHFYASSQLNIITYDVSV